MSDFDATALRDLDHQLALETLQCTADGVRNSPQDVEVLISAYEEALRDYEHQRIIIIDEQRRPAIPGAWPENEDPKQKLVRSYEGCKSRHDALSAAHPRLLAEAKHVDGQLSRGVSVWDPYLEEYPKFPDECKSVIEWLNSKTLPRPPRSPLPDEVAMLPPASAPTSLDSYSAYTPVSSSRSPRPESIESPLYQDTRQEQHSEVHGYTEITVSIKTTLTVSASPSTAQDRVQGGIASYGGGRSPGRSVAGSRSTTQEPVQSSRGATREPPSGNSDLGERDEDDGWASDSTLHD